MSNNSELPPLHTSVGIGLLTATERPADEDILQLLGQDTDASLIRALLVKADALQGEGVNTRKAFLIGYALRDHIQNLTDIINPLRPEELLLPPEPES